MYNSDFRENIFKINDSRIIMRIGNIVESSAEVIVSSDDSYCSMGGGVSRAILMSGGEAIPKDVQKHVPAEVGDVVVTTGGRLPQKYIFHCITRKLHSGPSDQGLQEFIIQRTIEKSLKLMHTLGVSSIAFPIIGTGFAGFNAENVLYMMAELVTEFLHATNKPFVIELYIYAGEANAHSDYTKLHEAIENAIYRCAHKEEPITSSKIVLQPATQSSQKEFQKAVISPNDKHDVFISYSRKDIDTVKLFCQQMDNLEIPYWLDITDEHTGTNFKEVIVDAIDNSQIVLFFSSKDSNQSPFVVKEIGLAVSAQKHIIPIRIDDTQYAKSIRFDLSDIDWIEYNPDRTEKVMQKFRYCLQLFLK